MTRMKRNEIILGIDPGTLMMGYAVVVVSANKPALAIMDVLKLGGQKDIYQRLQMIHDKVGRLIAEYQPTTFAIEAPFFGKNVQSMLKLGRAQGVAIAAAMQGSLPVTEYSPRKVKQAVAGNGNADKEQVWKMLQQQRAQWENRYEAPTGHPHHSNSSPASRLHNKSARSMLPLTWLAVAVTAGLIFLGALWWHQSIEQRTPKISLSKPALKRVADSWKQVTPTDTLQPSVPPVKPPSPSSPPVQAEPNQPKKKQEASGHRLFRQYFVADSLPFQLPDDLGAVSSLYENQRHREAIAGYQEVLAGMEPPQAGAPATRALHEEELTRFYAHYYLAQSLLSVNRTSKAVKELEAALEKSPNTYWSSKTAWYLALAFLKAGQPEKTQPLLQQVIRQDPSEIYSSKAAQLARNLGQE